MAEGRGAASPGPVANQQKTTLEALLGFHEKGIFTKEEIRNMVYGHLNMSPAPTVAPKVTPVVNLASPQKTPPQKRPYNTRGNKKKNTPKAAASPTLSKRSSRKKYPLRELSKDVTRRRFFQECSKTDSKL